MPESLIEFAERVKGSTNIVSVVEEYVQLKKSGANYKGVCPFHKEKTPSFMVSSAKQIFHCFGCGAGGDAVAFIKKIENLSYKDSVIHLAKKLNIPIPSFSAQPINKEKEQEKDVIAEINKFTLEFFKTHLKNKVKGKIGQDYIQKRNISSEMVSKFNIGLAPSEWTFLFEYLKDKGYSDRIINLAGLIVPGKNVGNYYDKFRNRLIFPIFDVNNQIIAFGGRALDDAPAKYINSPDTPLYKKSEHLYGLNFARQAIKDKGYVIIVEGYLDLITAHQYGFTNTVATLGTALTIEQARLLKRFSNDVIFIYDGDEAGQNAMTRGCEVLVANDITPKIAILPKNEDPDSFLQKNGEKALDNIILNAYYYVTFFLAIAQKRYKKDTIEGKVEIVNFLSALLGNIKNSIKKQDAIKQISEFLNLDQKILLNYLRQWDEKSKKDITQDLRIRQVDKPDISERIILKILLDHPELKNLLPEEFNIDWFTNEKIKNWILKILQDEQTFSEEIQSIISGDVIEEEKLLLTDIIFWEHWDETFGDIADKILSEHIVRLKIKRHQREVELKRLILEEKYKNGSKDKEILSHIHNNLQEVDDLFSQIFK